MLIRQFDTRFLSRIIFFEAVRFTKHLFYIKSPSRAFYVRVIYAIYTHLSIHTHTMSEGMYSITR